MRPLRTLAFSSILLTALFAQDKPAAAPEVKFTLSGHTDPVYSVAASPDGKFYATGSFDKSIKLWDAATGKEVRTMAGKAGHQNLVTAVAFAPNGNSLASASTDNTVKIWDIPTGRPAAEVDATAAITGVASSADGKLFAVGGADGTIRILSAADNKPLQTLAPGATGAVVGLAYSPNAQTLYSIAADRMLRYWNVADGKVLGSIGATPAEPKSLLVNAQNSSVSIAGKDGSIRTFPAAAPVLPKPFPALGSPAVAFATSNDGGTILIATADKTLRAFKADATPLFQIALANPATSVAVNANGTACAAVHGNRVSLFGVDGKAKFDLPADGANALDVAFHPTLPQLLVLGSDGSAKTWTLPSTAPFKPLVHPDAVKTVAISTDGKKVLTGGADKVVRVWSAGVVEKEFKDHSAPILGAVFAGDSILSADAEGTVIAWNPTDGKVLTKLAVAKKPLKGLFNTPGTKNAILVYTDGEVKYFAAPTTLEKDAKGFPHSKPVLIAAFTADSKRLATVCSDGFVRFWNPETAKEEAKFELASKAAIGAIAVSADRTKFAEVGGGNLTIRPLTPESQAIATRPFEGAVTAMVWNAEGSRLAIASTDADGKNRVRSVDGATGSKLQIVAEPTGPVRAMAFSLDGKSVLFGGDDKAVSAAELLVSATRPTADKVVRGTILQSATSALLVGVDQAVRQFEIGAGATAKEIKAFPGLPTPASALTASKDGAAIAAVSGKSLKVWLAADGKEVPMPVLPADGTRLAFNADRSKLAVGLANNSVVVIATATAQIEQFAPHAGAIAGIAFHPTLPILYSASADQILIATPLVSPKVTFDPVRFGAANAITSNGSHILTAGTGKGVIVANAASLATERTIGELTGITAIAINKVSTQLAAYTPANQTVSLFNYADGALIGTWKTTSAINEFAFHPVLPMLIGTLADNRIVGWNTAVEAGQPLSPEFGKVSMELPHTAPLKGFAFVGDNAIVTGGDDKKVRVWKTVSDAPAKSLAHPNLVNAIAYDKTGGLLATGGQDGILRIWDLSKNPAAIAKSINAHTLPAPQPIYAVLFTPDAKQLITASNDKSIKIWDAVAGTMVREIKPGSDKPPLAAVVKTTAPSVLGSLGQFQLNLPPPQGHTDQVYSLALSFDGKFLASGSADKSVKIWNAATGELVRALVNPNVKPGLDAAPLAHPGFVQAVRFNADASKLVSVGTAPRNKGYLALWNVADGKMLSGQEMPFGPIYSVDWKADGTALLGCGPKARGGSESDAVVLPLGK